MWTAGFAVGPIAAAAGLEVTEDGRIVVDDTMRSVSHPDVYAAGDSAYAIGVNGRPLPMSCASAGFTNMQATEAIVGRLTGRRIPSVKKTYAYNHISLGRYDAIFQMVDRDVRAKSWFGGRKAARVKSWILRTSLWAVSHPTFGMPKRKRRLTVTATAAGTTATGSTTATATTHETAAAHGNAATHENAAA